VQLLRIIPVYPIPISYILLSLDFQLTDLRRIEVNNDIGQRYPTENTGLRQMYVKAPFDGLIRLSYPFSKNSAECGGVITAVTDWTLRR